MSRDMTEQDVAVVAPTPVGEWTVGFHGALTPTDRREFTGVSIRDVALGRRSLGSGSMDALTELQTVEHDRDMPRLVDGDAHVGVNDAMAGLAGPVAAESAGSNRDDELFTKAIERNGNGAVGLVERPTLQVALLEPTRFNRRSTDRPASAHADPIANDALCSTVDAAVDTATPRDGEDLEVYIERRLEEASFVFLPNRGRGYAIAKRTVDLLGAIVLLVVALPIIAVLAVIIRVDSPGPAIFRQTRVTRGGRTFRFYKFRTMYVDAKDRFPDLYNYAFTDSQFDDAFYKLADDPRNTPVGRWLRRTTLDELPNLFNVVLGDLSLVGPWPELPELVRFYKPEELACFFTKAGLTGLAQVAGRSLLTVRERLTLDVRYVAHQTLLLDIRILCRTVLVVIAGRGAF